jgi:hypothetical protein
MKGTCQIYKRATLITPNEAKIIDYSDGTKKQTCEVTFVDGRPVHIWKLAGRELVIPLNVRRHETLSIMDSGVIEVDENSRIQWEFIFGKYRESNGCNLNTIILIVLAIGIFSTFMKQRE